MDSVENNEEISWTCWIRTTLAGIGGVLTLAFFGMLEAQSSVLLSQLNKEDSLIHVTPEEETWIASLGLVMVPISAVFTGPFFDAFGRKIGLQSFYLISCLGYAIMACAKEVYQLYIGRIVCGLGIGIQACGIVYLSEICTNQQREFFSSIMSSITAMGVTVMSIVGGYLPWYYASLIFSVTAFIIFLIQLFVPESPAWLFKVGREDAAIHSLQMLGRTESDIRRELEAYKLHCKDDLDKIDWRTFLEPTVWKPFIILVSFFIIQTLSGIYYLFFYSVDIVERLGTSYDPLNVVVLLSAARIIMCSTIVILFRSRVGRKFSVGFSAFWMTVSFLGAGVYEYMNRSVPVSERPFQWIPIAALLIYTSTSILGMYGLVIVMFGELFPLRVRSTMANITMATGFCIIIVFIKTYYMCVNLLKIHGLLFTCAGFSFIAILFAIFILPETQNKSLFEIEQSFLPKEKRQLKTNVA